MDGREFPVTVALEGIEAGKVEIMDDPDNEAIPSQSRRGPTPFER